MVACEACANRLELAEKVNLALQKSLLDARDIIAAKDDLLRQSNGIITRYEKMTANSGQISDIDDKRVAILQAQIVDDKSQIAKLTDRLDACQSSHKWYFLGGAAIGGVAGYKIRGAGQVQSPFVLVPPAATSSPQGPFLNFGPTQSEQRVREALKILKQ